MNIYLFWDIATKTLPSVLSFNDVLDSSLVFHQPERQFLLRFNIFSRANMIKIAEEYNEFCKILVLSNEDSDEPLQMRSLARAFTVRTYNEGA